MDNEQKPESETDEPEALPKEPPTDLAPPEPVTAPLDEVKFLELEEKITGQLGVSKRELADFSFRLVSILFDSVMNMNERTIFLKAYKKKYKRHARNRG